MSAVFTGPGPAKSVFQVHDVDAHTLMALCAETGQCAIRTGRSTGTSRTPRVTPPSTISRKRLWP
jgi:hypothetical protein